jgi:telomerase protein component 1
MLATFAREHERAHPEHLLVTHFVGASAASTNARQMLRRLWHELIQGAGLEQNALATIPDEWDKLHEGFPAVLAAASQSHRTVIVIDAVNQLDPAHDAHAIRWLPEDLPANVRVVLSVLPGSAFDALQKRQTKPRFSPIGRLSDADAGEIMAGFLERYRKSLDARQKDALLSKKEADNPLYLLTALEELRTLGTYEEITHRIEDLPDETQPLFAWILRRLESDDGFRDANGELNGSRIVRLFCSSIAISRAGMAEWELAELAGDSSGNTAALSRLLRPYLMYRGELLDFFHGQIREAAAGIYVGEEQNRIDAHRLVADLLAKHADPHGDGTWAGAPDYPRGVSELPYHLTEGQTWDKLTATLTDLGFLEAKCTYVAVAEVGEGNARRKVHGGVYELQDDYRRALEVLPA